MSGVCQGYECKSGIRQVIYIEPGRSPVRTGKEVLPIRFITWNSRPQWKNCLLLMHLV